MSRSNFSAFMPQKFLLLLITAAMLTGVVACKPKLTRAQLNAQAAQAFRTKQKIEAIKTYTALVTKYPDSEFAPKAQERLSGLGPMPATPSPKK